MLSVFDLAKRYNVHKNTIFNWRRLGMIPSPMVLSPQVIRWREEDIELFDDWIARRSDLESRGADPDQAREPVYSLPSATDEHAIGREIEATRNEQPPEDMTPDIEKIRQRIKSLKAQAIAICTAAGKPIPDELISAEVKS